MTNHVKTKYAGVIAAVVAVVGVVCQIINDIP